MDQERFLQALLMTASPSGKEDEARILLNRYLSPVADRFYTDVLGNSFAVINEDAPFKVMVTAHQDEIGAQVTRIDEHGFLSIRSVGGPAYLRLVGCPMEVITAAGRHVPAYLLNTETENLGDKSFEDARLFLDIGAKDKADAERLVAVGDYVVSAPNFRRLEGGRIVSKALDDKIGVYMAAEAFRGLAGKVRRDVGVYFVGAVQEELGSRGAKVAVDAIKPDVAFAIDVSHVSDHPAAHARKHDLELGKGIAIYRNANNTPAVLDRMLAAAKRAKIDVQLTPHYQAVSWTDASVLQVARGGVATVLLGVPNRYMHSQAEMVDMHDVEAGVRLLVETIGALDPTDSFLPPIE